MQTIFGKYIDHFQLEKNYRGRQGNKKELQRVVLRIFLSARILMDM
ncbi:MAG TPA: hypothetical protein VIJ75_12815 [Hanamia sp.]